MAAGYFLIQHKEQLGWKYIPKVNAFLSSGRYPRLYLMFYVSDQAPWRGPVSSIEAQLEKSQGKVRRKRGAKGSASRVSKKSKAKKGKKSHGKST